MEQDSDAEADPAEALLQAARYSEPGAILQCSVRMQPCHFCPHVLYCHMLAVPFTTQRAFSDHALGAKQMLRISVSMFCH